MSKLPLTDRLEDPAVRSHAPTHGPAAATGRSDDTPNGSTAGIR